MKVFVVALVLVFASALAPAAASAAVGAPAASLQSTPGTLYTVDPIVGTFTIIKNDRTLATFRIDKASRISRNGKSVSLGLLVLADRMVVRHAVGSDLAIRVVAGGPQVKRYAGPVADVQKGAGQISLTVEGGKLTLFTSPSSRFARRGQRVSLSQIQRGDVLTAAVQMRHRAGAPRLSPVVLSGLDDGVETAEVKGTISGIVDHAVTIAPSNGTAAVTVTVDDTLTIIEVDGKPATLAALKVGDVVEAHYRPTAPFVALSIEADNDGKADEAEVSGTVAGKTPTSVTIAPTGGGSAVTVLVGPSTEIEVNDLEGATLNDLKVGMTINAEYDTSTLMASEIEAESGGGGGDDLYAEVRGVITAVVVDPANPSITANVNGTAMTFKVAPTTRIRLRGRSATLAQLAAGMTVEVKYNTSTLVASKIDAEPRGGGHDRDAEVRGVITAVVVDPTNPNITVNVKGTAMTFKVGPGTRIRVDDHLATLAQLTAGMNVEVKYDIATLTAIKIEAGDDD